ncbi:MAG: hypothetical protein E7218_01745 [Anaerofustis stercorihominis]|nr:hypothetical protein [Anaerofustis stercorihominis]
MSDDKNNLPAVTDDNNKKSKSKKGKKSKQKKGLAVWKKVILVAFFLCCIVGFIGIGVVASIMMQAPPLDTTKFEFTSSTMVYDINGKEYQELETTEKRIPVDIEEIPELVQLAFISIEDQRFYSHQGVDIRGTGKAIVQVLTQGNLDGPGGSTITQQLIKLTHLSSEKLVTRKLMEWKLAYETEQNLSKREVLEAYLNEVNMHLTWGIQSAANLYFGVDASELSIAQSAVLASIINSPAFYVPYRYDTDEEGDRFIVTTKDEDGNTIVGHDYDNRDRAILVIDKMLELGHISKKEHEIALDELENNKIGLILPKFTSSYTYFTDAVYNEVLEDLVEEYAYSESDAIDLLLNGGLKIYSTVDPVIQKSLEKHASSSSNFPSQSYSAERASAAVTKQTGVETEYIVQVGGAIIENKTGYVSGIIGGREKTGSLSLNRALRKFQIGSTTKPMTVYAAGLDAGILTLASTFNNVRMNFGSWTVVNTPSTYTGMMSVRDAIVGSVNIVAVLAQKKVGVDISAEYAERFGLEIAREGDANDMNSAALALGGYTYGQTPLSVAAAYTTFPNGGYRVTPTFYTRVEDSNGTIILESAQETVQVISEDTAWLITSCLREVVRGGTTTRSVPGQQMGGKTGTTDSNGVTWFVGFTPRYTGAFWYGYDQQRVTVGKTTYELNVGIGGGGSRSPAQLWEKVFREFYDKKDLPDEKLPSRPSNVYSAAVDAVSGLAPTELTEKDPRGSKVVSEYFAKGTYPSEADNMHKEIEVCAITGKLPNEHCVTEKKVFVVKDPKLLYPDGTRVTSGHYGSSEKKIAPPSAKDVCKECTATGTIEGFIFSNRYAANSAVNAVTLDVGEDMTLYLKTINRGGEIANLTKETPTYSSDNTSVCTVSNQSMGILIKGVSAGTTTITARYTYHPGTAAEYTISKSITVTVEDNRIILPPVTE